MLIIRGMEAAVEKYGSEVKGGDSHTLEKDAFQSMTVHGLVQGQSGRERPQKSMIE